jgi:ribonuclease R
VSAPPRARRREGAPRRPALAEPIVAVLEKRGRFLVAEPFFARGPRVTIPAAAHRDARAGSLVLVAAGKRGPRIIRSLGRPDVARDVVEALMVDRGLRRSFPRAVERDAGEVATAPPVDGPRRDLTDLPTFTIDPLEAKDFDDAVSARREDGITTVWVHIADVSAYVRPGAVLEHEAFRRGTSVYVPGAVEPMLPEALSNRACSLVPGADRLAVTVEVEMEGHRARSAAFYRSRIRSDARLTYDQVDRVFAGAERAKEGWGEPLAAARAVAGALAEAREARGALEIDPAESAEPSFEFDAEGHVTALHHDEQTESHRVIEHLMILANEQVAQLLAQRRIPTLYRVHARPEPQSIEFLVAQLASLDVPTPPLPEGMTPQQAGELVGEISRLVAQHVRRTGRGAAALTSLVLRSLKQAFYSPNNIGHAGLASPCYCHFTSPIRRYPDLVVHRALLFALGIDDAPPPVGELEEAGVENSAAEREAMQIERNAMDVCRAFLLERVVAQRGPDAAFEGEVVGLVGGGAFIRFADEGFEGFLPARRLGREWWVLNEERTMLVGELSGRAVRLGDPVTVAVGRVDPPRGRVDLVPS